MRIQFHQVTDEFLKNAVQENRTISCVTASDPSQYNILHRTTATPNKPTDEIVLDPEQFDQQVAQLRDRIRKFGG